jgi:diamine N-acetyltransferase
MEINVRRAYADDMKAVAKLIRELAAYERMAKRCHTDPKKLRADINARDQRIYCLLAETTYGEPAGVVLYYFGGYSSFSNTWQLYLEDIFVREEFRKNGVGRKLLGAVARKALERNSPEIAFSVLSWNTPAIAAYKKLGAVRTGHKVVGRKKWISMSFNEGALLELAKH